MDVNEVIKKDPKLIKPETPCHACGSTNYYYRDKGHGRAWLCSFCHPQTPYDIESERIRNEQDKD